MTTMRADCSTEGCRTTVGFSFDMQKPEAERLKRKVFAVAGWLDMGGNGTFCPSCAEMLRLALSRMSRDQARQVQNALADALHYGRCEVVGL